MRKYEQMSRKMAAEHLYTHFLGPGHKGLDDVRVIIIDKTNIGKPAQIKGSILGSLYKLDTFVPRGLNVSSDRPPSGNGSN
jgi:hypothetical protein